MSDKAFVDSNIFIYSFDDRDRAKQKKAATLIQQLALSGTATISYQVVQEFFNFALVKAASRMTARDAEDYLAVTFRPLTIVPPSFVLIANGIRIRERYLLSWYDSLIVAAAQHAGCSVLYSEDFQHGQQFGAVTVRNPFL